jgi:hypothetical protein
MSLLEWIFERRNPGPIGTIEGSAPPPAGRPRDIVIRGVIAIAIAIVVFIGIARLAHTPGDRLAALLAVIVYCLVAYWVAVRPRLDNMGWFGGFVDDPFRWSDDANRTLLFVGVLLGPGRFVTGSLRDLFAYWRGERVMILPPKD